MRGSLGSDGIASSSGGGAESHELIDSRGCKGKAIGMTIEHRDEIVGGEDGGIGIGHITRCR